MKRYLVHGLYAFLLLLVAGFFLHANWQTDTPAKQAPQKDEPVANAKYQIRTFDLPDKLSFAGEEVPLHQRDLVERLDREIHTNIYWNTNTVFLMKRANRWLPSIEAILIANDIPADFKYLPMIESDLENVVSPSQAVGFWQLLKGTATDFGLEVNDEVDERYHPLKSTEAACKYLQKAHDKFGNWLDATASYNIGMNGLNRRMDEQESYDYFDLLLPEETARYVFRVVAIKEIMEHPERYGYIVPEKHLYEEEPTKEIEVTETIPNLRAFAREQGINYKLLKRYNPWMRQNTLTIKKKGASYTVLIPTEAKPVQTEDLRPGSQE